MASTGKNKLAFGGGAENSPAPHVLFVEVVTGACKEGEAYLFELPGEEIPNWYSVLDAIDTLYGHEGVTSLWIRTEE